MRGGGGWGVAACGVSANEYDCAHGAQIDFGDLTPYLTCGLFVILAFCSKHVAAGCCLGVRLQARGADQGEHRVREEADGQDGQVTYRHAPPKQHSSLSL
jgi:hypothetical protein